MINKFIITITNDIMNIVIFAVINAINQKIVDTNDYGIQKCTNTGAITGDGNVGGIVGQANGGYIVIKEDGDIVCYHFFDRNDLEDYLFYNTRFETPSTSRHQFGNIYEEDGEYYLKLNLQVRFK